MKLYEKYKPNSFEDMVGDYSFLDKIVNENKSNAFIFSGNAGVGKSSSGRIIASMLGAIPSETYEVNCGADTSIDNIRKILETVQGRPFGGAWVVILDEVHALSKPAQEALKIPLESGPKNVYYILCTTHPEKILQPIRTRCTEVRFKDLKLEELDKLIRKVSKAEEFNLSSEVLDAVAESAQGSARLALTLLGTCSTMEDKQALAYLGEQGGTEDSPELIELARLVYNSGSWTKVAEVLRRLEGVNPESIRIMLMNYGKTMLMKNVGLGFLMEHFMTPTYENGMAQVVMSCYKACREVQK